MQDDVFNSYSVKLAIADQNDVVPSTSSRRVCPHRRSEPISLLIWPSECCRTFAGSFESGPALPPMTIGQEIYADYGTIGLSLKGHPMQLVRAELHRRKVVPAVEVWNRPHGRWVSVAGIVTIRQRPGTAKGIVFETLEDETGIVNVIIQPHIYETSRSAAKHASLLQVDGYVERHGQVQHGMAVRLHDLSELVAKCTLRSRDFH